MAARPLAQLARLVVPNGAPLAGRTGGVRAVPRSPNGTSALQRGIAERCARILVADDDVSVRQVIAMLLQGHGFEVTTVSGGDALGRALLSAEHHGAPYDLLLTEVRISGENPFQVLRRIRGSGRLARTTVREHCPEGSVFFKAYALSSLGAIAEPFDASDLRRIVFRATSARAYH